MSKAVFFDLDGTLWDATESTARAWTDVFARYDFGIAVTKKDIQGVAGRPYLDCLKLICPEAASSSVLSCLLRDLAEAEKAWMGIIGGSLYKGAREAVIDIAKVSTVFLVSNCNQWYLESFISQSHLGEVFSEVICHGSNGKTKAENIRYLMQKHKIADALYIGDTAGDMEASLAASVGYIHVSFGFGGPYINNCVYTLDSFEPATKVLGIINKCFQKKYAS